ncbi:MAG: nucleoside triphosphate pyrophosphohydrolase [Gammaproteobacteria bacterium]
MTDLCRLEQLMRTLRDPQRGCPWDREQDFRSIVPHTLEEAYEVADAIERDDFAALPGELGDLLFQVVFYCQLAAEQERFALADIVATLEHKLVERHPHVFADAAGNDAARVARDWEARKAAARRRAAAGEASELDDVPRALPALTRAAKIQKRAARVGFDWPDAVGARAKLGEELDELDAAHAGGSADAIEDELGDVLFAAVNVARHLGVEPERALRRATSKFEQRFRALETRLAQDGRRIEATAPDVLDALWEAVKRDG